VTDLKIRHYIWLGLAAGLVTARRKRAELAAAGMGAAEPPVAGSDRVKGIAVERRRKGELGVGVWLTDLKIRHYMGTSAGGWGAVGGRRRLWFGARLGCRRR